MRSFSLFGVPVRIEFSFLLLAVFLGFDLASRPDRLLIWCLIVLFSVLVHEFGHAMTARRFGLSPAILIHGMGGTTQFSSDTTIGRHLLITLAGPFAGLALGVAVVLLRSTLNIDHGLLAFALERAIWVNVGWSVFNLLPILPLDGGQATRQFIALAFRRDATSLVSVLGVLLSGGLILLAVLARQIFMGLVALNFLVHNVRVLRAIRAN
jgi:Zn-dependent protease